MTITHKPNSATVRLCELPDGTCEVEVQVIGSTGEVLRLDVPQFDLEGKFYRFKRWDENQKVSVYEPSPSEA